MSSHRAPARTGRAGEDNEARVASVAPADPRSPAERYAELFEAVQLGRVFEDSKTFVDCIPRKHPDEIVAEYRARQDQPRSEERRVGGECRGVGEQRKLRCTG